ncbi:sulfatase-like hydrolase/transferase [Psychroserpens sp. Hel_I_66]|uniref:sulfatase-like hydrolase/transferase n=1 Tax=Psychroserpens sp. Hel_I_66 TaxID=1250004 RepID=UPI000648BD1F|nr:sulfatase-like hydrolase/transferase [Psychroserpens sp. Hel_I_66]
MISKIRTFVESNTDYKYLTIFAAGLYPFLHYFNSNLHISNSWQQLVFMLGLCFVIPIILLKLSKFIFKLKFLERFESQRLAILNITIFLVLIGFLVFNYKKKVTVLVIVLSFILGLILYKHIKKIVVSQLIISLVSAFTLVPVMIFAFQQNNKDWAILEDDILKIKLQKTPNIFVIQPDGYVNRSEINSKPYELDNEYFYNYLEKKGFMDFENFRSNYYSTMTSNASMFAMKHHYYSNTFSKTGKTFNANEAIVGKYNNVLNILKNNGYSSHLMTDNSFFLIDRKISNFDFINVKPYQLPFVHTGKVNVNIEIDLGNVLDTISSSRNFFFIEKTIPSHIRHSKASSLGALKERERYANRLQEANDWLTGLIETIEDYDSEALVIIVADHGGYVGFDYTMEAIEREMSPIETLSCFSSILSIKWPRDIKTNNLEFRSNVNLFRSIFYNLSEEGILLKNKEKNESYIPLREDGKFNYYKCIDDNRNITHEKMDK